MSNPPIQSTERHTHSDGFFMKSKKFIIALRMGWSILAICTIGLYLAALPHEFAQLSQLTSGMDISYGEMGFSLNLYAGYILIMQGITVAVFMITAFIIFWSRSDNRMTVLVSIGLLTFGAMAFPTLDALVKVHPQMQIPVLIIQAIGLGSALLVFYLFPNGQFVPRWTRALAYIWGAWTIAWIVLPTTLEIHTETWPVILQSIYPLLVRVEPERIISLYNNIRLYSMAFVLVVWFGSGIFAQIYRYRHISTMPQRQQTKWVVFGLSTAVVGYLFIYLLFGSPSNFTAENFNLIPALARTTLLSFCYILVPVTLAISILRFQLWDVDFLINQTLVYVALTTLVGAFYIGNVILLQAIFRAFTGETSDFAIVISTLVLAALFQPFRKRLQSFIDRLFFREKIDFRQAFTDFSLEIRTIIDLPELLNVLLERVTELLHIQHGAVYLYEEGSFKLNDSINLDPEDAAKLPLNSASMERLRSSSAVLNPTHPVFPILVPLMAPRATENQFIGILALGTRLSGQGYVHEDRALLYSLTDQAGTAIHVAQLIQDKQAEIQRREAVERDLDAYHNSPAGKAEALATVVLEHSEFALLIFYSLAQDASHSNEVANMLDNLPQAFERLDAESLTTLARAFAYIYARQLTPELLMVGMRSMTSVLQERQQDFINGEQFLTIYSLFHRSISANSIPQIIDVGRDNDWEKLQKDNKINLPTSHDQIPEEILPFLKIERDHDTGKEAIETIPTLINALKAYERVDTTRDKLAYLASALEGLRHADHVARSSPGSADRPIVQQIAESWMSVVTSAMTDLQTSALIVCQLLTRNTWRSDVVSLVLSLRNDGRGSALNMQITLAPAPEYTLLNASETVARLAPGEETQIQLSIRPRLEEGFNQLRARFVVVYTDPRGPDQVENFADIVQLLSTTEEFQFIPNPYVVGTPLQPGSPLFFGRGDVIEYIQQNLAASHRNNLVLIGQRRTGKTSLLKQLPAQLGDEYLPVYLDGQSLGLDPGVANFFLNMATEISFALEDHEFLIDSPTLEDFTDSPTSAFEKTFLPIVRETIGDRHLLILLDEFEELEAAIQRGNFDASVLGFLRHLIQHTPNLSVIFCGTHRIEELAADYWNVLFNISLYHSIGLLEREEAFHLIEEPVREYGMRYDDLALDKMWRVTAGHPYFMQLLCHSLVNWHNKSERNYMTISDVNAALDEILASGEAHFVYLWTEATPIERLVLTTMSRMTPLTSHATSIQIIDYLDERGVTLDRREIQTALHKLALRDVLESHEDLEAGLGEAFHWKLGLLGLWVEKYQSFSRVMDEVKTIE